MLICTVGGAPEPVVRSILEPPRPDRVVFVCSTESRASIDGPAADNPGIIVRLAGQGAPLAAGQYDFLTVSDPQNLTLCVQELDRRLTLHCADWKSRGPDSHDVVVDPTGGTKCMSVALALVARRWPCAIRYIGGASRNKGGLGIVEDNAEVVYEFPEPLEWLGHQLADPLGERFSSLKLDDRKQSPLAARNSSVLAHGFQAIGELPAAALFSKAMELAGVLRITPQSLFRFPPLRYKAP